MKNLQITVFLKTPLLRNAPLTLDSVIGGMLFSLGMAGTKAAKCDGMIAYNSAGIPQASEMILPEQVNKSQVVVSRLSRSVTHDHFLDYVKVDKKVKKPNSIRTEIYSKHDLRAYQSSYNSYSSSDGPMALHFICRGDGERIKALLDRVGFIGTRTAAGFGQIHRDRHTGEIGVDIQEIDAPDDDLVGIIHNGHLVRPVPVAFEPARRLNTKMQTKSGRYENPYSAQVAISEGYSLELIRRPYQTFLYQDMIGV